MPCFMVGTPRVSGAGSSADMAALGREPDRRTSVPSDGHAAQTCVTAPIFRPTTPGPVTVVAPVWSASFGSRSVLEPGAAESRGRLLDLHEELDVALGALELVQEQLDRLLRVQP